MVEFDTPLEIKHEEYLSVVMDKQSGIIKHIEICITEFSNVKVDYSKYSAFSTYIMCECEECS